ncbi:SDR family oxidoreductase [Streptomyces sp. NPDC001743]|uniref:SDR family oxidoreductase n=1 Tax=Streptomyces sp. NPDC001743 TaxID=3154397 RepID=UPI0033334B09
MEDAGAQGRGARDPRAGEEGVPTALHGGRDRRVQCFTLAQQVGPHGVTANVVVPGFVAGTEFFGEPVDEKEIARRQAQTLVGEVGEPDDIAAAVAFLASPEARYITGEFLNSNGGAMLGR